MSKRCGIVAIIGEPNAGKSTLVNCMAGGKVSIVSPKVQTTRHNVRGICMVDDAQIILVDTPGIFDAKKPFEQTLVKTAWRGLKEADSVLLLIDARKKVTEETKQFLDQVKRRVPAGLCLVINKVDKVKKQTLLELASVLDAEKLCDRIFMISALKGDGVEDIKTYLSHRMPEGNWLYPADQLGDLPTNQLAAEITREKVFYKLAQELPYSITVVPEQWKEEKGNVRISQCILVQKENQKKIVIGKGGAMLKQIGMSSRRDLEKTLGKTVHLSLFVKVVPNWQERG